jgi:hypothetical protein
MKVQVRVQCRMWLLQLCLFLNIWDVLAGNFKFCQQLISDLIMQLVQHWSDYQILVAVYHTECNLPSVTLPCNRVCFVDNLFHIHFLHVCHNAWNVRIQESVVNLFT